MNDETNFIRQAIEWSGAAIAVLVGVVYKKHESDIIEIQQALKCRVPMKDYEAYQLRAGIQRTEMLGIMEKIFDKIEHQGQETQSKFESLMAVSTNQHLNLLTELNKKVDR